MNQFPQVCLLVVTSCVYGSAINYMMLLKGDDVLERVIVMTMMIIMTTIMILMIKMRRRNLIKLMIMRMVISTVCRCIQ